MESYPNMLLIDSTSSGMSRGAFLYEENTWYKLTVTGSPNGEKCKQNYVLDGPVTIDGKPRDQYEWNLSNGDCMILDAPLKVYATTSMRNYGRGWSKMDGVVRNLAFTNTETDTTMNTIC